MAGKRADHRRFVDPGPAVDPVDRPAARREIERADRDAGPTLRRKDQLFDRHFHAQRHHRFGHKLGRARADDVHAEDLVVLLLGHNLHETIHLARHASAGQGPEREAADPHLMTLRLRLRFRQADAANLRLGIRAARHVVVIDRLHGVAGNPLREHDAFHR
jgi:hypothetical protein